MTDESDIPPERGSPEYLIGLCARLRKRPVLLRKEFGISGRTLAWERECREAEAAIAKAVELLADMGALLLKRDREVARLRTLLVEALDFDLENDGATSEWSAVLAWVARVRAEVRKEI